MKKLIVILFALLVAPAHAILLRSPIEGTRPAGMGNAFLAVSDDQNALWYNPAGLAESRGVRFHLFDFSLGVDSLDTLSRLKNAIFNGDFSNLFRTDTEYLRLSVAPAVFFPYFAISAYLHSNTFLDIQNFTVDPLDIVSQNDAGIIVGLGLPAGDYLSFGVTARVFQRVAVDETITALDLLTQLGIPQSTFEAAVYDYLYDRMTEGWAIGINAGAILKVPVGSKTTELRLAAVAQDFGGTRFMSFTGSAVPDELPGQFHFGGSLKYRLDKNATLLFAVDWRDAFGSSAMFKRISGGVELKAKSFALRAGVREGRWSAGISFDALPHTRLHFVTFGRELGESLWEREHRWYLMQLVIGFNPY